VGEFWSARVGLDYRAVAKERTDGTAVTASATPARAGNGTRTTRAVTAKAAPKQAEPPAETSD